MYTTQKKYKSEVFWVSYDNGVEDEINQHLNELQDKILDFELVSISASPAPIIFDKTITAGKREEDINYQYALDNYDEYCVVISYKHSVVKS